MKTKLIIGTCILMFFAIWNVKAASVTIPDANLELALREALEERSVAGGPHAGGSWLPPIPQGSIDDTALGDAAFGTYDDPDDDPDLGAGVLYLNGKNISNIAGLENVTAVKTLVLSNNNISSLSYTSGTTVVNILGGLTNLLILDLGNNRITSLTYTSGGTTYSVLEDITACEALILNNNRIKTLSFGTTPKTSVFDGLTALAVLNLNNNEIASATEILYIGVATALQGLYLSNNLIAGALPNLGSLTLLSIFQINNNKITDFSNLDKLPSPMLFVDISGNVAPTGSTASPVLSIRRINPTVGGETMDVEIYIGSASAPISNLYGISMKLNWESDGTAGIAVDDAECTASTLLGTTITSNFEATPGDPPTTGTVSISISKQGTATGKTGYGQLATIPMTLDADVSYVKLTFSDVAATTPTGSSITVAPVGFYVIAGDSLSYIIVWPGDTDESEEVDASDLLGIAEYWGATGAERLTDIRTPSNPLYRSLWFPQAVDGSDGWEVPAEASADCNGDGVVDEKDVLVIALNFGKTTASYTPPLAPQRNVSNGYSLSVLNELLRSAESMPNSESRDRIVGVLKDAIAQTQREFIPKNTIALQNYPNPFNPETWIPFQLAMDSDVSIMIFDAAGKCVRVLELGRRVAGSYMTKDFAAYWDGKTDAGEQVSSGVYFYNVKAGDYSTTKKMVILK